MKSAAKAPNLYLPVGGFTKPKERTITRPVGGFTTTWSSPKKVTKKPTIKNGVHITEKKIKQGGKVTVQYRGVIWQSGKMIWQSCEYYQKKPALINSMKTVVNHLNKYFAAQG